MQKIMPELREPAQNLVEKMKAICDGGSGRIKLIDIISLFPGFPNEFKPTIEARGNIEFEKPEFSNFGKKETIEFPVEFDRMNITMEIEIPMLIKGTYHCKTDEFGLLFNEDHTLHVCGRFLFVERCTDLVGILVSTERIFIDMKNNEFDLEITFQ